MGYFSNGTEGAGFSERYCANCVHDAKFRAWEEAGGHGTAPESCPVWNAHFLFAYDLCNKKDDPGKVILDMLIERSADGCGNRCVMFVSKDGALPGQTSLFGGAR